MGRKREGEHSGFTRLRPRRESCRLSRHLTYKSPLLKFVAKPVKCLQIRWKFLDNELRRAKKKSIKVQTHQKNADVRNSPSLADHLSCPAVKVNIEICKNI